MLWEVIRVLMGWTVGSSFGKTTGNVAAGD